ncbi:SRPBCC family protein [Streptomyces sp. R35]|uniref:SRPBCC family protein n=1 Tax=Streptomyces sp. R35 TaxID=3238630 RepID=A0AB39SCL4_9ACTN
MNTFEVRRTAAAPPDTVFDVFTDHRGYAALVSAIRSSTLQQEGDPAPNGLGAVRVLRVPGATIREQVTEFNRPSRYSYRMLSGAPLRFSATVAFNPVGQERTEVVYTVSAEPSLRALGPVANPVVKRAIVSFTDAAVAEAEARTAPSASHPHRPGQG